MPRWICPYCEAVTTVTEALVGHRNECLNCHEHSIVADADVPKEVVGAVITILRRVQTAGLGSVTFAITGLSVLGATAAVTALPSLVSENSSTFFGGVERLIILAAIGFALYPILEGINEIHRSRKLLEELLKARAAVHYRKIYRARKIFKP